MTRRNKITLFLSFTCDVIASGIFTPIIFIVLSSRDLTKLRAPAQNLTASMDFFATISVLFLLVAPMIGAISDQIGRKPMLIFSYFINLLSYLIILFFLQTHWWFLFFIPFYLFQFGSATPVLVGAAVTDSYKEIKRYRYLLITVLIYLFGAFATQYFGRGFIDKHPHEILHYLWYGSIFALVLEFFAFVIILFYQSKPPLVDIKIDLSACIQSIFKILESRRNLLLIFFFFCFHIAWGLYMQEVEPVIVRYFVNYKVAVNHLLFLGFITTLVTIVIVYIMLKTNEQLVRVIQTGAISFIIGLALLLTKSSLLVYAGVMLISLGLGLVMAYFWYIGVNWLPKQAATILAIFNVTCVFADSVSGYIGAMNVDRVVNQHIIIAIMAFIVAMGGLVFVKRRFIE